MLHLRRLSYFVAVLDHATLVAASQVLHVAQPALSRQIRILENELGLTLFERDRGRLVPTPSGLKLGGVARTLLAQADLADRAARSIRAGKVEHLLCVTTRTTDQGMVAPFVMTLSDEDPIITTREVDHGEVEHALSQGADFAIAPLPPSPRLESRRLATFPVLAVVGMDHPWARERRRDVTLDDLVEEFLILPPESSISRQELDRSLRASGLALRDHLVSEVDLTTLGLAVSGRGVAVTTSTQGLDAWAMPIMTPAGDPPRLSLYVCWQREHYASGYLESLAGRLEEFVQRPGVIA